MQETKFYDDKAKDFTNMNGELMQLYSEAWEMNQELGLHQGVCMQAKGLEDTETQKILCRLPGEGKAIVQDPEIRKLALRWLYCTATLAELQRTGLAQTFRCEEWVELMELQIEWVEDDLSSLGIFEIQRQYLEYWKENEAECWTDDWWVKKVSLIEYMEFTVSHRHFNT
ncbi:MAG: hypothetical protein AVO38_11015 [delta proteobacterium ML8_D]|nr:MAG: hypothetical protein AVO34_05405 [Firmicutes bacterium ML8_F2]OPL15117.1 MAG: hypothetical protein AVO38_11015 [delta proteobacterium ML8_D]